MHSIISMGCTVVQLVALLPCSKKVLGLTPGGGLSAWSLHVLPMHAWVLTGYSGFLPQSKNMTAWLAGLSKLPLGVNGYVCAWLFVLYVSVLPCDRLATCPECTLPPAHRLLEIGTSPPVTRYGICCIEDE
ncbi:hypothetical protein CHARACLAT_029556 [Characodon lateralis]|uniref:Uncharacterized protein n=1 Tax=Characodon lateralis TaxID=208331 RepID=A0ABU7DFA4_9TELE|nr:hypothetical protein [Characodon lateralis]